MQLEVILKKTTAAEITYLKGNKEETRYRLKYLEVLK